MFKTSKIFNSINVQKRDLKINRIIKDILNIFNESNWKLRKEINLNPKYFLHSENDYKQFLPTQVNNSSFKILILNILKVMMDECMPPEFNQNIFLKGNNNKIYLSNFLK